MGLALALEDFERTETQPQNDGPPVGYEQGFADGIAATEAAREKSETRTLEDIAQTLADLDIGYAEARSAVLQSLNPLVQAICDSLLPTVEAEALAPQLIEMIEDAAKKASASHINIALSEADAARLTNLPTPDGITLSINADQSLTTGQAVIRSDNEENFLDLPRASETIRDALASLTDEAERTRLHG